MEVAYNRVRENKAPSWVTYTPRVVERIKARGLVRRPEFNLLSANTLGVNTFLL